MTRYRCDPPRGGLEYTTQQVWISRQTACDRVGWRGVPLSRVDLLIDQRLREGVSPDDPRDLVVLEVREPPGRYSGEVRDRLTWRIHHGRDLGADGCRAEDLPRAKLDVEEGHDGQTVVTLTTGDGEVAWERTFARSRWECDGELAPARLVTWCWQRHYQHLRWDDVSALAEAYQIHASDTVSQALREASRQLYRLSRDLGWRKLTLRERRKLWGADGADRPQWHRMDDLALRYADLGIGLSATGCGEATIRAAGGGAWEE